jgi:hypothetical protein
MASNLSVCDYRLQMSIFDSCGAGLLLVLCSHDWQPEISDQSMWLAGRSDKSETAAAHCCQEALGPEFKLLSAADMPRLLHDHSRRFTVEVLEATVWCRAPCA